MTEWTVEDLDFGENKGAEIVSDTNENVVSDSKPVNSDGVDSEAGSDEDENKGTEIVSDTNEIGVSESKLLNSDEVDSETDSNENIHSGKHKNNEVGCDTKKKKKSGVIYLSALPKFMNVTKVRDIFSLYGETGRIFLQPAETGNLQIVNFVGYVE